MKSKTSVSDIKRTDAFLNRRISVGRAIAEGIVFILSMSAFIYVASLV